MIRQPPGSTRTDTPPTRRSSDLAGNEAAEDSPATALRCQRRIKQDGLEHLAIDGQEGEPEQEPGRAFRERRAQLCVNIALPLVGLRLSVHPDADRQENDSREQGSEALGQFAARPADSDEIGRASCRERVCQYV